MSNVIVLRPPEVTPKALPAWLDHLLTQAHRVGMYRRRGDPLREAAQQAANRDIDMVHLRLEVRCLLLRYCHNCLLKITPPMQHSAPIRQAVRRILQLAERESAGGDVTNKDWRQAVDALIDVENAINADSSMPRLCLIPGESREAHQARRAGWEREMSAITASRAALDLVQLLATSGVSYIAPACDKYEGQAYAALAYLAGYSTSNDGELSVSGAYCVLQEFGCDLMSFLEQLA